MAEQIGTRIRPEGQEMSGFFVTSTDAGVGKTLVACALVVALRKPGLAPA
ncbi:MAG: hypothetical protein IPL06_21235 [Betaproteobacteria bacterium]|nr:hypothetical protein [Betaproteobacteria bacterium]